MLQNAIESALFRLAYSDVYKILRHIHALQRAAVCCSMLQCVLQCVLQSGVESVLLRLAYSGVYEILRHVHALQRVAMCSSFVAVCVAKCVAVCIAVCVLVCCKFYLAAARLQ